MWFNFTSGLDCVTQSMTWVRVNVALLLLSWVMWHSIVDGNVGVVAVVIDNGVVCLCRRPRVVQRICVGPMLFDTAASIWPCLLVWFRCVCAKLVVHRSTHRGWVCSAFVSFNTLAAGSLCIFFITCE